MSFSKIKDVDRIILQNLDDKDLFSALLTNKYLNSLVDENFWMNRVLIRYPETFKFKESHMNWRNFYLSTVYYINEMKIKYGFDFTKGDPKKYYHALRINNGALSRSKQAAFLRKGMEDVALHYANELSLRFKRIPYQLNTERWEEEKKAILELTIY